MKSAFFPAEAYHQDYAIKHPYQPYIAINDAPKVEEHEQAVSGCVARSAGDSGAGEQGTDTHQMPRQINKRAGI
jgi:hypothetical protein